MWKKVTFPSSTDCKILNYIPGKIKRIHLACVQILHTKLIKIALQLLYLESLKVNRVHKIRNMSTEKYLQSEDAPAQSKMIDRTVTKPNRQTCSIFDIDRNWTVTI